MTAVANSPFQYIKQMALTHRTPLPVEKNSFLPGSSPWNVGQLGNKQGELADACPPYTLHYHNFAPDLRELDRFHESLARVTDGIKEPHNQIVQEELSTFQGLLKASRLAYQALPQAVREGDEPAGLKAKNKTAREAFKALRNFLEVRISSALFAIQDDDPTLAYFGVDKG